MDNRRKFARIKLRIIVPAILLVVVGAVGAISSLLYQDPLYLLRPGITIENMKVSSDKDKDGVNDALELVQGARDEVRSKTTYKSAYYIGGYPPASEGVCTDVVIRAMLRAGYRLKDSMDSDIAANPVRYAATIRKPDPNIDFRRVRNQIIYFQSNTNNLTLEVVPYSKSNLSQWQPGDIVVLKGSDHVGVISDKRLRDGVPYVIHNTFPRAKENAPLMRWYEQGRIIGHFRIY